MLVGAVGLALIVAAALLWYPPLWQKEYSIKSDAVFAQIEDDDTVNVNTAGVQQLCLLPGIGAAKAQAIVEYRDKNGPFASLDSLSSVSGIGPGILKKLEGLVSF